MGMKKFNAIDIANYIILRAREMGIYDVTHLKLQKLLYYVLAKYFKKTGKRLVDEDIYKWQYGPVIKSVYHQFKLCSYNPITKPLTYLDPSSNYLDRSKKFSIKFVNVDDINNRINKIPDIQSTVDYVLEKRGLLKPFELVDLTHKEQAWMINEHDILKSQELSYSDQELLDANI